VPTIHQFASWFVIAGFAGLLIFSLVAVFHVEEEKKKEFRTGLLKWGPFVPESLLTPVGKKWALARNICALCFAGGGLVYGIVMRLLQP